MGTTGRGKRGEGRGDPRIWVARRSSSVSLLPSSLASLALLLSAVALTGCGYHLIGHASSLPARFQKLCVVPFLNQSGRAELDQRLTEKVSQEWVRRGRFQLVSTPEQADVVLLGTVIAAASSPVQFDQYGRATQFQLTVVTDVQFVDRTGEKPVVMWRDQHFTRSRAYNVNVTTATSYDYFDQEVETMDLLAEDFARGLVITILEGF